MLRLGKTYGYDAMVAIFGHEIGHYIEYLEKTSLTDKQEELKADTWAGCAVRISQGNPDSFANMSSDLFTESETHPPSDARIKAFMSGFEQCWPASL
jgi:hypothetical protein